MDPTDGIVAFTSTIAERPLRLARIEAQQREILSRLDELATATLPALVTLEDAVRRMRKSARACRRLAVEGVLPGAVRVGRIWRVDLTALRPPTLEHVGTFAAEARRRPLRVST